MNFLHDLNDAQREAAANVDGPMMVIAGAGSGKTRVLTYRIAHMMTQGVDPFSILALTFTNKAAREMKDRIGRLVGESEAKNLWMGTFHSVFARILRIECERINYPRNFTIYDTQDSRSLLKDIIKGTPELHCSLVDVDRYGRLIMRCLAGDTDIGEALVEQGLAMAYRRYSQDYVTAERDARQAKRGLWQGRFDAPWDWRKKN